MSEDGTRNAWIGFGGLIVAALIGGAFTLAKSDESPSSRAANTDVSVTVPTETATTVVSTSEQLATTLEVPTTNPPPQTDPPTTQPSTTTNPPPQTDPPTTQPSTTEQPLPKVQVLADLQPVAGTYWGGESPADIDGKRYLRALQTKFCYDDKGIFVEYNLGRDFTTLTGVLGLRDDSQADKVVRFEIRNDGEKVLEGSVSVGRPMPVSLDVSNVLRLQLFFIEDTRLGSCNNEAWFTFADAELRR